MTTDIQITRTKDEPGETTLRVEAPVERVQAAERKAASRYAKRVRLPGFRKGKVPLNVIRRRFGDAIKEAVVQELLQESWKLALEKEDLEPIAEPRIRGLKIEENSPVTFEILVEVKPEVNVERLGGFSLQRKVAPVSDEMVGEQLEELRRQKARWVPVEGEKPQPGQMVRITIDTEKDGEEKEGRPYELVIGQDQALPEVEDKIMQLLPGETTDTTITFPSDTEDQSKQGHTISARITLYEVKEQQLPELDGAFAAEVGDFDSVDDLREAVRKDLEENAKREADADVRRQLVEQIAAANDIPAPQSLVNRLLAAYREAYRVPDDQADKFAAEFVSMAETQVKRDLLLEHIAERHDLKATEEDIDERVEKIATARDTEPGKVFASLQRENRIKELERSITEEKVFAYLLEQSPVIES
ncbi:MAG: trigger factor [Gemmatimonadetes bacterium]|nr:trigger factor [Gemmatimonadota bacterium]